MSQRRWVIAALVFLVIGLVALWRSKISMSQTQSVSLRGGASLAYAGVSYGRPEAIPPGENWKHAFSFLPKRALDKFNLTVSAKFPLATNNLMIWFQDFPSNSPFLIQAPNTIVGLAKMAPNVLLRTFFRGLLCRDRIVHRTKASSLRPFRDAQSLSSCAFIRRARTHRLSFHFWAKCVCPIPPLTRIPNGNLLLCLLAIAGGLDHNAERLL